MGDIFVRYLAFPRTVRGVTIPNDDGTFSVYINTRLSEAQQRSAYTHELAHIRMNHFYDCEPVIINERQATAGIASPPAPQAPLPSSNAASPPAVQAPLASPSTAPPPTAQAPLPSPNTAPPIPLRTPLRLGRPTAEAREHMRHRDQSALLCWEEIHLYRHG